MERLVSAGPNREQITYWNEVSAAKWIAFQELLDRQLEPLGRLAMERAQIVVGERVLDAGCGCGHTTLELARRVGASGGVVGIDISTPMLETAKERARAAGISNASFWNADVQLHPFAPLEFDVVFSRFGVMFFTDPTRAFANLGSALRPAGRLSFVCWQSLERNPWMAVPMAAAAREIPFPLRPAPDAPGPFSFADPERVRRILLAGGFEDIVLEPHEEALHVGAEDLDRTVDFLVQMGPTGSALREAGPSAHSHVRAAVREALAPFHGERGLRMGSAAWLVRARRPSHSHPDLRSR
jgi:SAM-dependent methyltransferase